MPSKKIILILVIIAIILASVSIGIRFVHSNLPTGSDSNTLTFNGKVSDLDSGKVGIEILPPVVEDKNSGKS